MPWHAQGALEQSLTAYMRNNAEGCLQEGNDTNYEQTPAEHNSLACQGNTHFPHSITNQSIQHKDTKAKPLYITAQQS